MELNIVLYLPWPPTVNSYYKHVGGGRGSSGRGVYISKKGREFRESVEREVSQQLRTGGSLNKMLPLIESLSMDVFLFPPDNRKRDLDNHIKALQDSLTHCNLWVDDSQIDQLNVYRCEKERLGKCIVRVGDSGPILSNQWVDLMLNGDIEL